MPGMADEHDGRGDVIPRNLNELDDVDGVPQSGDTLVNDGETWSPVPGATPLLPSLGPVISVYEAIMDGDPTFSDDADFRATGWNVADWGIASGYEEWPVDPSPVLGAFDFHEFTWIWRPTEPGIYQWRAEQYIQLSGAPHATAKVVYHPPQNQLLTYFWSDGDRAYSGSGDLVLDQADRHEISRDGVVFASQGLIDAGLAGVMFSPPTFTTSGAERLEQVKCSLQLYRHSPGSLVDYFGEV